MRRAKAEQGFVIATIFVNPLQFGPNEDYAVYPRDLERDARMAEMTGIDVLFAPDVNEMYPAGNGKTFTYVDVDIVTSTLCGASRPGHFRGVATVVAKLINMAEADTAYFGQKDAQQLAVIRQMVSDLNMNVKIAGVPIVREADRLAMSSRNKYLSPEQRVAALVLSKSLALAREKLLAGERSAEVIIDAMKGMIQAEPLACIDYISIVDGQMMQPVEKIKDGALIAMAVRFDKTRLIDNMTWEGR
jgi:pantoate--beta-alanine ligase